MKLRHSMTMIYVSRILSNLHGLMVPPMPSKGGIVLLLIRLNTKLQYAGKEA